MRCTCVRGTRTSPTSWRINWKRNTIGDYHKFFNRLEKQQHFIARQTTITKGYAHFGCTLGTSAMCSIQTLDHDHQPQFRPLLDIGFFFFLLLRPQVYILGLTHSTPETLNPPFCRFFGRCDQGEMISITIRCSLFGTIWLHVYMLNAKSRIRAH